MDSIIQTVVVMAMFYPCFAWKNSYDGRLNFNCDDTETISQWNSVHSNLYEDRKHDFGCRRASSAGNISCFWTGYINDLDKPIAYQCPIGGYINGVSSYHGNRPEDRRFRFRCCQATGVITTNCSFSEFSTYDKPINYFVPDGKVLAGVVSLHHDFYNDRKNSFLTCEMWRDYRSVFYRFQGQ